MIKTLIVDDERLARAELKRLLAAHSQINIVAEAASVAEARNALETLDIDLIFLDIQMPEVTGLEFAAELQPHLQFVFCTAFHSYALDAFALNALDYLVKPLDPTRLASTVQRFIQRGNHQTAAHNVNYLPEQHGLLLKFGELNRIVRLCEISRFESIGNHSAVYTPYGKSFLLSSLSRIESRLDPQYFFKSSRADIIRIDQISQLEPGIAAGTMLAVLQDGSQVEVSRRQLQTLKQRFSGF
ncbi:LytR/AlgR family response regulator transcription factor [Rheinheimera sp. 4Y26]|uniref:LytR/AlgR family response regulator transcription factor n=1 Tax=Rheinheimera sp. 4Y26 TaxID=2977811 RepID=UPI0021B09D96|nr:LytTR family DNA-binding domain-containing protein [Rheinheimera sp. 4Y26]MCT6700015.1 LytTR family DNA-binding domain-containing protein [Rheinheimera sp. 4Y26]